MAPPGKNIKIVLRSSSFSINVPSSRPPSGSTTKGKRGHQEQQHEEENEDSGYSSLSLSDEEDARSTVSQSSANTESVSPKRLTARQKAIQKREKVDDEEGLTEQTDHLVARKGKKKDLTEEEMLLESEKIRKRRHQRDQKLEESQRATIERLLQKQSSRSKKSQKTIQNIDEIAENEAEDIASHQLPAIVELSDQTIKFVSNKEGESLIVPEAVFNASLPKPTPFNVVLCSVKGCKNPKSCSLVEGRPICSFECYKKLVSSK